MPFGVKIPPAAVPKLPIGPIGVIIGIIQFIMQLFGFGQVDLKPITQAVNNTWANLAVGSAFLYNAVRDVLGFLKKLLQTIFDALKHIISDVLHGHLLNALHDIQKLFHSLQDLFGPILKFIARVRGWFYKYIYPWVKLVQNILSAFRVILSAFKLLGAKWAAKLDADIARIQGYITGVLQAIVGTLNQATTWINFAIDPMGIFRRGFFTTSLFGSIAQVRNVITFGKDRFLTASEAANTDGDRAMLGGGAAVLTRNADGSVTFSDASKRINDNFNSAWDSYGPPARRP